MQIAIFVGPWIALLLFSILAIPIASMMDKRKALAGAYEDVNTGGGGGFDVDDEPLQPLDEEEPPASPVDDMSEGLGEEGMIEVPEDSVDAFGTGDNAFA